MYGSPSAMLTPMLLTADIFYHQQTTAPYQERERKCSPSPRSRVEACSARTDSGPTGHPSEKCAGSIDPHSAHGVGPLRSWQTSPARSRVAQQSLPRAARRTRGSRHSDQGRRSSRGGLAGGRSRRVQSVKVTHVATCVRMVILTSSLCLGWYHL